MPIPIYFAFKSIAVKIILTFIFSAIVFLSYAQEGMWMPIYLDSLNEKDMQGKGFHLTAEDIYSVNHTSMKDAVVLFGGGCTGEVISNEGLVVTNHHCGFDYINNQSTLEHNYLKDGFWTAQQKDEIPCPGLTVTFVVRMENVTDKIIPYLDKNFTEQQRAAKIKEVSAPLEKAAVAGTNYTAQVRSFYYGNEFYLFVFEIFRDIRLVGAPPASIGNFGGETDNWVWPRHACDFSLFRIYADSLNHPADYSPKNKPYAPRYFFPISIKGVNEGDFTMVFGFPGRTQEYLPSCAVDLLIHTNDPDRILCRDARIGIMNAFMHNNDTITLQYGSKVKGLANSYKKWKGEVMGLEANHAIGEKESYELLFMKNIVPHSNENKIYTYEEGEFYKTLLPQLENAYAEYKPYSKIADFTQEATFGIELINYAGNYKKLAEMIKTDTVVDSVMKKEAATLLKNSEGFFKNYYQPLDKKEFAALLEIYDDSIPSSLQPVYFRNETIQYKSDFTAWSDDIYAKSNLSSYASVKKLLSDFSRKKGQEVLNDPAFILYTAFAQNFDSVNRFHIAPLSEKINALQRQYMDAQRRVFPHRKFYPDANLTLRVAYGNVKGYYPRNAVYYTFQTNQKGIEEKYKSGDEDFDVPEKLLNIFEKRNFGKYADANGDLPINFIASNHTTGGNSGSPVLNADGQLIGINFDRVWEGTMSDIMYDESRCRNIAVDMRYVLFIIDKYAGAKNIMTELKVVD